MITRLTTKEKFYKRVVGCFRRVYPDFKIMYLDWAGNRIGTIYIGNPDKYLYFIHKRKA